MTGEVFLTILIACSTISSLITEATKEFLKGHDNVPYNFVVLAVSMIVGCIGVVVYYEINEIGFSFLNIIYMLFMGIANWVGAMVGYDKVKQALSQIG